MSVKTWKIQSSEEQNSKMLSSYIQKLSGSKTMLLDLNKTKYNLLEKFIYETAMFHFKRLNIIDENKYVEFSCKTNCNNHNLRVICDETNNKYIYPLQSCVSYFTNCNCPSIITNIDMDRYLYKDFDNSEIFLSFPELNKQITFDGKFFHGCTSLSEEDEIQDKYIIAINLWNIKPSNVEYYLDDDAEIVDMPVIISIDEDQNIENTIVSNSFLNRELFENILYKNDKTAMYSFKKIIKPNIYSYKFIKQSEINTKKTIKQKNLSLKNDINEIINSKNKYNRFIQRFQYNKIYTPDMCKYIINECEKYAETNNGWTTDLQVDKISSIFSLILISLTTIIKKIKKSYNLDDEVLFDVNELFVVKYEHDKQNNLEMHNDVSFFLFNILLSDQNDFEEGETYFEDGLTTSLEQGDLLIHSSRTKHSNKSVTKGVQYVLVGFLDIKIKE
jgi:hypothetical protein